MNAETIDPAATEAAITAAVDQIIARTAAKHGISPADLPQGAIADARRAATEMVAHDAQLANDPYRALYEQEKAAHALTAATLGAVKENRTVAANNIDHRHTVTAERARELMGRAQWFTLTEAQKIAAVDVDPKSVDKDQVRLLFGKGASSLAAVDFQRANPKRYAALREVAKALNIYGA